MDVDDKTREFAQALVDLYDAIDGVADEMPDQNLRAVNEFFERVEEARHYLAVTVAHVLTNNDGHFECACGWEPPLGSTASREFDRHLAQVRA